MLEEFYCFSSQNFDGMLEWFNKYLPDFNKYDDYMQLQDANPDASEVVVLSQYGAIKWLQLNRLDYQQVVTSTPEELRTEIKDNRDLILSGSTKPTSAEKKR